MPFHPDSSLARLTETPVRPGVVVWIGARPARREAVRSEPVALLEAGHVGQNALLAASSLGLGAVPLGGLYEGRVEELLGVNGVDESLVYALAFGRRAAV